MPHYASQNSQPPPSPLAATPTGRWILSFILCSDIMAYPHGTARCWRPAQLEHGGSRLLLREREVLQTWSITITGTVLHVSGPSVPPRSSSTSQMLSVSSLSWRQICVDRSGLQLPSPRFVLTQSPTAGWNLQKINIWESSSSTFYTLLLLSFGGNFYCNISPIFNS